MNTIHALITQHPYTVGGAAVWVLNVMALRMPPPDAKSGKFYQWFFGVAHTIAGAIPRVAANFLPPNSILYKLIAGGNGGLNGNADTSVAPTKPNGAPPPAAPPAAPA